MTGKSSDVSSSFTADVSSQNIIYNGTQVQLAVPHTNMKQTPANPETCETSGNVEYYTCSACKNSYSDQAGTKLLDSTIVPATGHDYGAWDVTPHPAISTTGTATRTCKNNSSHTETKTIPKLSDTTEWEKTVNTHPTKTEKGEYIYNSENFDEETVTVPKLTDDPWKKTGTTKPTIDTDGSETYKSDYGTEPVTIPKLSDTATWTKKREHRVYRKRSRLVHLYK